MKKENFIRHCQDFGLTYKQGIALAALSSASLRAEAYEGNPWVNATVSYWNRIDVLVEKGYMERSTGAPYVVQPTILGLTFPNMGATEFLGGFDDEDLLTFIKGEYEYEDAPGPIANEEPSFEEEPYDDLDDGYEK